MTALRKTIEELNDEMFSLHAKIKSEMAKTVETEIKKLDGKSDFRSIAYDKTGRLLPGPAAPLIVGRHGLKNRPGVVRCPCAIESPYSGGGFLAGRPRLAGSVLGCSGNIVSGGGAIILRRTVLAKLSEPCPALGLGRYPVRW